MKSVVTISHITKISLLSAIAVLLMFWEVPVPLMPAFLKLDASDLPALVGALAFGPLTGIGIELLKNLLHLPATQTAGIGEMANFLVGATLVAPVGWYWRHVNDSRQNMAVALLIGTAVMSVAAALLNYFVLLPLYQLVLHFPLDRMIAMGTAANAHVVDLSTFITLAILPFNICKGLLLTVLTLLVYTRLQGWLRNSQLVPPERL